MAMPQSTQNTNAKNSHSMKTTMSYPHLPHHSLCKPHQPPICHASYSPPSRSRRLGAPAQLSAKQIYQNYKGIARQWFSLNISPARMRREPVFVRPPVRKNEAYTTLAASCWTHLQLFQVNHATERAHSACFQALKTMAAGKRVPINWSNFNLFGDPKHCLNHFAAWVRRFFVRFSIAKRYLLKELNNTMPGKSAARQWLDLVFTISLKK